MKVCLPDELDSQIQSIARAQDRSKHAVLVEAVQRFVEAERKSDLISEHIR